MYLYHIRISGSVNSKTKHSQNREWLYFVLCVQCEAYKLKAKVLDKEKVKKKIFEENVFVVNYTCDWILFAIGESCNFYFYIFSFFIIVHEKIYLCNNTTLLELFKYKKHGCNSIFVKNLNYLLLFRLGLGKKVHS